MSESWRHQAQCKGRDIKVFFTGQGGSSTPAKSICAGCAVRRECLEYALRHKIVYGIWGGLTEKERRAVQRRKRRSAA